MRGSSYPLAIALLVTVLPWMTVRAQTPTVTGYNGTQTFVTSVGKDPDEPNACGVVGGSSYWFTYMPPTNALVTIDSIGSSYNTVLGIYVDNGQNLGYASLVPVTCNDNYTNGPLTSRVQFTGNKATNYYIMLDGVNGATGTAYLNYHTDSTPTITAIANKSIAINTNTGTMAFTIGDLGYGASTLTLSGISTNQTLVPTANIVFGGSGSSRTVMVTPSLNQFGTNTLTVVVANSCGKTNKASFVLSVSAPGAPTISTIANKTISANTNTGPMAFTISNAGYSATNLTVIGISTNQNLVATSSIVFSGNSTNRTVTVTPNPNKFGTNTITIVVSNPVGLTNKASFVLSVTAPAAPTISTIANKSLGINTNTGPMAFTVSNAGYSATNLTVIGISTNQNLVATSSIVFSGNSTNRTVTVTPNLNKFGTNTITVVVSNPAGLTNKASFVLSVASPGAPTISAIANKTIAMNTNTGPLAFTISSSGYSATNLTLTGISTNQTLVATSNIVFGGSGTNRTVTVTPTLNNFGTNTITVVVSNPAGLTNKASFVLSVTRP